MNFEDRLIQQHINKKKWLSADVVPEAKVDQKKSEASKARYALGAPYEGHYFTYREAQCMVLFINGKTVDKVAERLHLSPRTVEYYLNNMKSKLKCRTKSELIGCVMQTRFLENVGPHLQPKMLDS